MTHHPVHRILLSPHFLDQIVTGTFIWIDVQKSINHSSVDHHQVPLRVSRKNVPWQCN